MRVASLTYTSKSWQSAAMVTQSMAVATLKMSALSVVMMLFSGPPGAERVPASAQRLSAAWKQLHAPGGGCQGLEWELVDSFGGQEQAP